MKKDLAIEWKAGPVKADVTVAHGQLQSLRIVKGKGRVLGKGRIQANGPVRLECRIADAQLKAGAFATRLTVAGKPHAFTCFVRDINRNHPIYIPAYGVIITESADRRSYAEIEAEIRGRKLVGKSQRIELEPEETYENACRGNRNLMCPTWLGLGRDMRFFEVGYDPKSGCWGYVQPRYHSTLQNIPESGDKPYNIGFVVGPGASCRYDITRRLEDGVLPILRSTQREENVHYHLAAFCTLENRPLSAKAVRGSEWRACYPNTGGNMLTPGEREKLKDLLHAEMRARDEETVCVVRVEAVNMARTPQYAWFKGGAFNGAPLKPAGYQSATGFGILESGRVFVIHRLNGAPMPEEEMAVLLQPGKTAIFEILIPHQPLARARAVKLAKLDFQAHLIACRKFWRAKLAAAASIQVPEQAINERIQAGLLHCDIATLGKEPDGALLATIGWYAPIGSESAPIIQFFDSMGWHHLAKRALQFFLDRQREDGFIQNFGGYQLETGPALWTMGEHYRYTRDNAWVKRIRPNLLKACEFLLKWRERNKKPELRGKGYGLLDGKVADPQDFFHSFMLNGLSYLGIQRVAEMLAKIDPQASRRLAREAREFKRDIRAAFYEAFARSPVVPVGDGTWVSSAPPWTEYPGALALYAEGGKWFTHGTFSGRDSLIGALYLVISEVLDPDELGTEFLLKSHQALMTVRNAGLSQPYYCRHDYIHLKRGEVKAFLKTYYNQLTALQDRETYTFWEHYFHASQHKTHEEAWFLMQTRWMLWLEQGDALHLLKAIPRAWLKDGQTIQLNQVASYFGPVSLKIESQLDRNRITAQVVCNTNRKPKTVLIRLPHPEGRKAVKVEGGVYDAAHETVRITPFKGKANLVIYF
ncbi:MAG: hypothetical protein L6437_09455 [Kiritimatiellae bacterium]|nr:hypothetical protein [Kiritimatiellia bacterium]